ncbi:MAG: LLM class flavin-dependent oxidoreductase [Chloroflexi bacterium]|nr:LLM class flavin-dependent oxidoreductase [Chloroflexota bacterium]
MRVGTYYFVQATPDRPADAILTEEVDQMVLSEQLGFDSIWLTEHHYSDYGLSSAPSVLLSSVAARTERITLGMAVYVLPFHHPLRLAEETATLDILSGGRLVVGLGRGNRPIEFLGHGVPQDESRTRMEEGVEVLLRAWTEERVSFQGRHWQIDGIPVYPKPRTRPHPPLAFAVTSTESLAWAGQHGYAIMSSGLFTPIDPVLRQRETYVTALRQGGQTEAQIASLLARWIVTKHVYVAPTDEQARAEAEAAERWYLDAYARSISPDGLRGLSEPVRAAAAASAERVSALRWEDLVDTCLLVGSPETVRRKALELRAAGVGELVCWMNFGGISAEGARRSMRLFADEVMPALREPALPGGGRG